jgi:hypothetical protein
MASLLETLFNQLGGANLKEISNVLGTDEQTTTNAITAALPSLVMALSRNASSPGGAEALSNAVSRDHDGGILNDVMGFLGSYEEGPGQGILGHIFGGKQDAVQSRLSRATGMDTSSIGELLKMLAPLVLGALGRVQRTQNLDAGGLASMLNREQQTVQKAGGQPASLFTQILDADGDGEITDDLANMGLGLLQKFLRK